MERSNTIPASIDSTIMSHPILLLASTSPYRRMLFSRFGLPFSVCAPEVDETPLPNEKPCDLVTRLAESKARTGAALMKRSMGRMPESLLVIGSDQTADCGGLSIGKPGNFENACAQLKMLSGKTVIFRTGVAVFRPARNRCQVTRVDVATTYRTLGDDEIVSYLRAEKPFNCAGSVRSEDRGIALFDRIENTDPTALIGLPLIKVAQMLREEGVNVLR
jgi:septum formation protein